ncbi:MAG TPA: hypothetical protein VFQ61_19410 [Polyangiaceae bacterium]|nr:hypothetical protein [Polyangiaceae bacterium]
MMKKTCAVLAVAFSVFGLVGCGGDDDDSPAKGGSGGSGGTSSSSGGSSSTGGSTALPAWEKDCHDYCAKRVACETDLSLTDCYDYKCQFQGVPDNKLASCQAASQVVWACEMKQPNVCDSAAVETACSSENEDVATACN